MSLVVRSAAVLDRFHHNGDAFWDGDQTLYELEVAEQDERASLLVVVPRGDAFISAETVSRHVESSRLTLADLPSSARKSAPSARPQIALPIEPGED